VIAFSIDPSLLDEKHNPDVGRRLAELRAEMEEGKGGDLESEMLSVPGGENSSVLACFSDPSLVDEKQSGMEEAKRLLGPAAKMESRNGCSESFKVQGVAGEVNFGKFICHGDPSRVDEKQSGSEGAKALPELTDKRKGDGNARSRSELDAVRLTQDGDPDKPSRLSNLGSSLSLRSERLDDLDDIHQSVSLFQDAGRLTTEGKGMGPGRLE